MESPQARVPGAQASAPTDHPVEALTETLASDLPRGFECLVNRYHRRFYVLALRMLNSGSDAEEVTQDTFVRAYRALAGYPPERIRALRLDAWLYRILLNLTRNRVQARPAPTLSLDDPEGEPTYTVPAGAETDPEDALVRREDANTLARALGRLPFHMRAAVILRHVQGHTYREIAALLDQPEGTVKAHVHRGTRLLRVMVADEFAPRASTPTRGGHA